MQSFFLLVGLFSPPKVGPGRITTHALVAPASTAGMPARGRAPAVPPNQSPVQIVDEWADESSGAR